MRMTPDTEESIRCTVSGCSCVCFKPGSTKLRSCDRCGHGWVAHALEKLQAQSSSSCGPVEVALPGLVFDLSSLVLYGAQAVPVRLKILLDRLYSVLTPEQVGHILHTLGWSLGDYVRGYMLQYPSGKVLDRWTMVTPEEELLVLKQFLRFGETRPIVELMTLQCLAAVNYLSGPELKPASKSCHSNISTSIKHNRGTPGTVKKSVGDSCLPASVCRLEKGSLSERNEPAHHFENFPEGLSLLLPFHFPNSAVQCLVPPTKDLAPPTKLAQYLQKPSGTKLAERHRLDRGRRTQENESLLQLSKGEPALKIKADPDKPNPAQLLWHLNPCIHSDQELDLHRVITKQEKTSSLSPSLNSPFIPISSSLHPSISSSSPPKIYQKLQGSAASSFHPLPSFSSSFLGPLPSSSSFSSSLHPLPSSSSSFCPLPSTPCSLPSPSPSGGRKGRVCCGVCGKSFYDKGTLKIHYNAVHLKIKHRCTVAGCTMVFSSLRSRNRHSANPNPRLHTGASRDAHTQRNTHSDPHKRQKEIRNTLWQQDDDAYASVHVHTLRNGLNNNTNPQHGSQQSPPPQVDPSPASPHTLVLDTNQNQTQSDSTYRSDLQPQVPPHPPPPPPLFPVHSTPPVGSPPSLFPSAVPVTEQTEHCQPLLGFDSEHTAPAPQSDHNSCNSQYSCTEGRRGGRSHQQRQWESGDPTPKKKPRKSSMPVKIARELEGRRNVEEDEC